MLLGKEKKPRLVIVRESRCSSQEKILFGILVEHMKIGPFGRTYVILRKLVASYRNVPSRMHSRK